MTDLTTSSEGIVEVTVLSHPRYFFKSFHGNSEKRFEECWW